MIPAANRGRLKMCLDLAELGDVVRFRMGPYQIHLLSGPSSTHRALVENQKNYGKQWLGYQKLAMMLGQGLVTSDGDFWRRQRRIAQPTFHRDRIAGFAEVMARRAQALANEWEASVRRGESVVDVSADLTRVILGIIGETMLSYDMNQDADRLGPSLTWLLCNVTDRITGFVDFPLAIPTPNNLRFRRELAAMDTAVYRIIEERRRDAQEKPDLLSMFMAARDEDTGERMTDKQLRDEIMTMLLAGFETTVNTLNWMFHAIAKAPDVGRKLHEELERELNGRAPTLADLPRLTYTKMVVDEALRLYPPVWIMARSVKNDDEIDGFHIPGGSYVFICPYIVNRHPSVWENPEGFDPERFAPGRIDAIPKKAYIPFATGPRACIGKAFALLEMQITLATLWQRFRLDLLPTRPIDMDASWTLRPQNGLPMKLHLRRG
jgi:cytochrome P450